MKKNCRPRWLNIFQFVIKWAPHMKLRLIQQIRVRNVQHLYDFSNFPLKLMYRTFSYQIESSWRCLSSPTIFSLPCTFFFPINKITFKWQFCAKFNIKFDFHFQLIFSHELEVWNIEILLFSHLIGGEKSFKRLKT